ncbi:chloramphenicol phosphotransferase CPT family protein [Streptomyces beijiangensis]|uniref:AAA family ATPase n=1 Tax=Streptomyces beijiangensis TaxID=163361 RepID=A0A939F9B8_9ACTN|nr:AAA family ATPase [Streptomyces beijiangensis]MBO0514121.1 AAA family ATPase [Streptomyces beijiangensis]
MTDGDRRGRIVFLNGTSSSGKSSIADELVGLLDGPPYYRMAVDGFLRMTTLREEHTSDLDAVLRRMRAGFHRSVAAMASAGNDVIVDHVLSEPWRLADCLEVLPGADVLFVGVHCPLAELERREAARGDREAGIAALQFGRVHAHGLYDVECDTGTTSARDCALLIRKALAEPPASPTAFERLRGRQAGV